MKYLLTGTIYLKNGRSGSSALPTMVGLRCGAAVISALNDAIHQYPIWPAIAQRQSGLN